MQTIRGARQRSVSVRRLHGSRIAGGLLAACLLLSACNGGSNEPEPAATGGGTESEDPDGAAEPAGGRQVGGEVVWAFPSQEAGDFVTLDPNIGNVSTYANSISSAVFDSLVYQDPETNEIVGGLAESWELSDDGLMWTIKLRDGVKFHDGTPLTADDVVFTMERTQDPQYAPRNAFAGSLAANVDAVTAIDDLTVEIRMSAPQANFLSSVLGRGYYSIVSRSIVEATGVDEFGQAPIGTGPYKLIEWIPNEHILLERNPDYTWGPSFTETAGGPPDLQSLKFVYIAEPSTRLAAFLAGEVNVIDGIPEVDQSRLETMEQYQVIEIEKNGQSGMLDMNGLRAPLDNINVRRAIANAIDRDAINTALYAGVHSPNYHFVEARMLHRNEAAQVPGFDLGEANRLLDEEGWEMGPDGVREKDGSPLELEGLVYAENARLLEFLQGQLSAVGIKLNVNPAARSAVTELVQTPGSDWDLHIGLAHGRTNEDPNVLATMYGCAMIPPENTSNLSGHCDEEIDELLDLGLEEFDPDQRQDYYYRAQVGLAENLPNIPLLSHRRNIGAHVGIHGFMPDARGTYRYFHDMWMEQ